MLNITVFFYRKILTETSDGKASPQMAAINPDLEQSEICVVRTGSFPSSIFKTPAQYPF